MQSLTPSPLERSGQQPAPRTLTSPPAPLAPALLLPPPTPLDLVTGVVTTSPAPPGVRRATPGLGDDRVLADLLPRALPPALPRPPPAAADPRGEPEERRPRFRELVAALSGASSFSSSSSIAEFSGEESLLSISVWPMPPRVACVEIIAKR